MRQKFKFVFSIICILVLLPYIITVFINGPSLVKTGGKVDSTYVKVRKDSKVTEMPLEDYCLGILAKEISVKYKPAALQAQAILVRTRIYKEVSDQGTDIVFEDGFWTTEDMKHQWGAGKFSAFYEKLKDAWEETDGEVITYKGNLASAPFHQMSNGNTRDGKEVLGNDSCPYLKTRKCPKDVEAKDQMQTMTIDYIKAEVKKYDSAGYAKTVKAGDQTMSGEEFRDKYGLASSCFTLQKYKEKLRITTKGIGHGLGMSQYTANEMAKEGNSRQEIIKYFFEGVEIKEVAEILQNTE